MERRDRGAHLDVRRAASAVALLAALCSAAPAAAEPAVNDPGLVAAAKREGTVNLYIAMEPRQLGMMLARFEAAYGIKVAFLRIESDKLPARVITEERGGRHEVDVVADPGLQIELLKRQGLLGPLRVPENADLLAGTTDRDGYWSAVFLNTETISYNPLRARAAGLRPPKTWEDLAAKEWRGQFSLYATGYEWYAALKKFYGKDRADALLRAYAANQPRMVSGHTFGIGLALAGEVIATVNTFGYDALIEKDKGSPIELVNPTPTVIETFDVAIMKAPPHPNAARLFARWLLSRDTQQWIRTELHRAVPRKDVKNDPRLLDAKVRYVVSNPSDEGNAAQDRHDFNALLGLPD